MNPYNKKIAVCFAGGTGGHFVFQVVNSILFGSEILIRPNGSCHKIYHLPESLFVHTQYPLDNSVESFTQEREYLKTITHNRILGHIRQLNLLEHKCIYIDFTKDQAEEIKNKLIKKTSHTSITESAYNLIKGEDWPEYGQEIPNWVKQEMAKLNHDCINDWTWSIDKDCFKIDYATLTDPCWLDNIADWLQMSYNKQYIVNKMKEYEALQR